MTSPPGHLWFHADSSLLRAETVWVELPDGRPFARFHHRATRSGHPRWSWTGGGVPDFVVEAERSGSSFLITEPRGAPFGRIRQRGLLVPRLVASDADQARFTVELDGRVVSVTGGRELLAELDLRSSGDLRARLHRTDDDPTLCVLLLAAPLCHVAQTLLLQV